MWWLGWEYLSDVFVDEFAKRMLPGGSRFKVSAFAYGRFGGLRPPLGIGESREGCSLRWMPVKADSYPINRLAAGHWSNFDGWHERAP